MGSDTEHPGNDAITTFDDAIEDETSTDERRQELAERYMPGANARPDTGAELRRIITADPVAVSAYETAVSVALGRAVDVVADEAWVNAETRHVPIRCKHATDLAHEAIELIDVCMYECHAKRVDAARSERQVMSVCAHCAAATLPGEDELVYREVKSDNAPASRLKGLSGETGAASEFDNLTRTRPDELRELVDWRV